MWIDELNEPDRYQVGREKKIIYLMNFSLYMFPFGTIRKPRLEEINSLFQVMLLDSRTQPKR